MKSLKESLFDDDLVSNNIIDPKYIHPKDVDELTESIKYYVNLTNHKKGDTIDLNWIDTSKINDMNSLFDEIKFSNKYNFDVSKWDVSNVKDMAFMFRGCKYFNCDLSKWDVSKVRNMKDMFAECEKFNSDLSKWNVSNVVNMYGIFYGCEKFDSDLSKWDVSKVEDMDLMFVDCDVFNCDLSKWDVGNVKFYGNVFSRCPIKEKNKPQFK